MISFEFDTAKSESNRTKHGIDFVEAQLLWTDPMLLEIPAKTDDEPRYLMFEQQFDDGVDITASLDLSKAKRVLQQQ
jgi:uncharacterized DUF497 family protein